MKHTIILLLLVTLLLVGSISTGETAANPIAPPSDAAAAAAPPAGSPPASYLQAVRILQESKYGENDIRSFVYQIFSLFDRHAEVSNLLLLFADDDLYMKLPEGLIDSHREFEKWYAGIGAKYQSNLHKIERLDVQILPKGDYRVELVVLWQALDRQGKFTSFRARQQWKIVDGGGYWPRIVSYIVEPAL